LNILEIHKVLNEIYDKAEKLNIKLNELHYKTTFQSYNNHFININGEYYRQKYYMPVISVEDKGDICFNIDLIEFEFYITKDKIIDIDLDKLIRIYKKELHIYEYENCTIDIYKIGDREVKVLSKINNSADKKFGISIDCSSVSNSDIIQHFNVICSLLNKNSNNIIEDNHS